MSKLIPLTQGKYAIVDDEDYAWAIQWEWYALKKRSAFSVNWYAVRHGKMQEGRRPLILLHREIAALTGLPLSRQYDHRDGNGLNNQRGNIRICSHAQNRANSRKTPGTTSQFKGVSWHRWVGKWSSQMTLNGKRINLGHFTTEEAAHAAYAEAAKRHFGEFARP